mgnify:CR=1 FL=1
MRAVPPGRSHPAQYYRGVRIMCNLTSDELNPKSEVLNWLVSRRVLLWEEVDSGVIDASKIDEHLNTMIRNVDDY